MADRHPWNEIDEREHGPQPGVIEDCGHGVEDLYETDPSDPSVSFEVQDVDDLNIYDEADDVFDDDDEDEDEEDES